MNRLATVLATILLTSTMCFAEFPTNTSATVVDLSRMASDFSDFRWNWLGFSDQRCQITTTRDGTPFNMAGYYGLFKASKEQGGSNVCYVLKTVSQVTITASNFVFHVDHTNVPPDGTYYGEAMLILSTDTNVTRTIGRGTIAVRQSLYRQNDSTFQYPVVTNLLDYLTVSAASGLYERRATNSPGANLVFTSDAAGSNYWSTAGMGSMTNLYVDGGLLSIVKVGIGGAPVTYGTVTLTTNSITNVVRQTGFAFTTEVYAATNGLAPTSMVISVTNGLAPTGMVIAVTNGLAPTNWVISYLAGYTTTNITGAITNGLAPTSMVLSVTNGLAPTSMVISITNGLAPTTSVVAVNGYATGISNQVVAVNAYATGISNLTIAVSDYAGTNRANIHAVSNMTVAASNYAVTVSQSVTTAYIAGDLAGTTYAQVVSAQWATNPATGNVKLNGNMLSYDGDTMEGVYVDSVGRVFIATNAGITATAKLSIKASASSGGVQDWIAGDGTGKLIAQIYHSPTTGNQLYMFRTNSGSVVDVKLHAMGDSYLAGGGLAVNTNTVPSGTKLYVYGAIRADGAPSSTQDVVRLYELQIATNGIQDQVTNEAALRISADLAVTNFVIAATNAITNALVSLAGTQTITGNKTFSGATTMSVITGTPSIYNAFLKNANGHTTIEAGSSYLLQTNGSVAAQWDTDSSLILWGDWQAWNNATNGKQIVNYQTMTNYVGGTTNKTIVASTGLSGGGPLTGNVSLAFDTTWGDSRYLRSGTNSSTEFYVSDSSKAGLTIITNGSFAETNYYWVNTNFNIVGSGAYSNWMSLAPQTLGSLGTNSINATYPGVYTIAWNSIVEAGVSTQILFYAGSSNQIVTSGTASNSIIIPTAAGNSNLVLQVLKSASTVYIDDITMRRSTNGTMHVAHDVEVGNKLSVAGSEVYMGFLPTSIPSGIGMVWNSNGFLRITQ